MTVSLEYGWRCLDCDEHGTGREGDKVAERHGKGYKHSTVSWAKPKEASGGEAAVPEGDR